MKLDKLAIVLLISSLMFSCGEERTDYPIPEEAIDYFASYGNGSWWSYRDSSANGIDTVIVTLSGFEKGETYLKTKGGFLKKDNVKYYNYIIYNFRKNII